MEMNEETRARYHAWMRRKILKRVVLPFLISCVVLYALINVFRNPNIQDDLLVLTPPNLNEDNSNIEDSEPVISLPSTYRDFDFKTYNEYAINFIDHDDAHESIVLVNKVFRLPTTFTPSDLIHPNVFTSWNQNNSQIQLNRNAARAVEDMFEKAYEEYGLILWLASGYRSYATQRTTHQYFIDTYGIEEAERVSARPGHSEHQTGLAMDITSASVGALLTEEFSLTPEGVWVKENAHRFGLIIRYPEGTSGITGVDYEPWHLRYVGTSAAREIFNNGWVLEQFVLPVPIWDQP